MTAEKLVKEAYAIGMAQDKLEITDFTEFLLGQKIVNVLEIGTKMGGTFHIFSSIATGNTISVDLQGGDYGGWILNDHPYLGNIFEKRSEYFASPYNHFINASSHEESTLWQVKRIVSEVDLLFIDGDHSYHGSKMDYDMYKPLVRPGGIIAFHDINNTENHRDINCRVDLVWEDIKGVKFDFNSNKHYGGIGVIIV